MADQTQIFNSINHRYKDLGDGSFAPVVALDGGVTISSVTVSDVEISNDAGNPIPTEPLGRPTVARQLAATIISASVALTTTCKRVSIHARGADLRYVLGVGAQTATASTSHFIGEGERLDLCVLPGSTIAVVRETAATADGSLDITELG